MIINLYNNYCNLGRKLFEIQSKLILKKHPSIRFYCKTVIPNSNLMQAM